MAKLITLDALNKSLATVKKYVDDELAKVNTGGSEGSGSTPDYGPYSIRYNSENNRLEFIYTPTDTTD